MCVYINFLKIENDIQLKVTKTLFCDEDDHLLDISGVILVSFPMRTFVFQVVAFVGGRLRYPL